MTLRSSCGKGQISFPRCYLLDFTLEEFPTKRHSTVKVNPFSFFGATYKVVQSIQKILGFFLSQVGYVSVISAFQIYMRKNSWCKNSCVVREFWLLQVEFLFRNPREGKSKYSLVHAVRSVVTHLLLKGALCFFFTKITWCFKLWCMRPISLLAVTWKWTLHLSEVYSHSQSVRYTV